MIQGMKRFIVGKPLHNKDLVHEKLPKWKAIAIFSSDALSSVAYGPEQIIIMLTIPGFMEYGYTSPVALAILALLTILALSYAQVSRANPGGGGSYSVAQKNIGETPALVAAASLFVDYCLTVSVSIAAGTDAIISALPSLNSHRMLINLVVLFAILMVMNLRGVRESATAFVFPTYGFILGIFALITAGTIKALTQPQAIIPPASLHTHWSWPVLFLVLRAFSSGCSSVTGVEAISNGVPMFKKPETHNAQMTTFWMTGMLGLMLAGITFLIMHYHILPLSNVTALSQVAEKTFGRGLLYYYIQVTTTLVLFLAANTSYNGLPPLLSILARDGYMPRYLSNRGDRLSFSNGIILLSVLAAILLIAFDGSTDHLIALYAIGVFTSFTIAQYGMVVHWRREKGPRWIRRAILNAVGAVVTCIVVIVIAITKFTEGAWVVLIIIPCFIYMFRKIHSHYQDMREQLGMPEEAFAGTGVQLPQGKNHVVVPIAGVNRVVANTLGYAKTLSDDIVAFHVAVDEENAEKVINKWSKWEPEVELITFYSPYRTVLNPLLNYIDKIHKDLMPGDYITVLIPEFETKKWWHRLLHNQTGWILRTVLVLYKNVVVTVVPFKLEK